MKTEDPLLKDLLNVCEGIGTPRFREALIYELRKCKAAAPAEEGAIAAEIRATKKAIQAMRDVVELALASANENPWGKIHQLVDLAEEYAIRGIHHEAERNRLQAALDQALEKNRDD